ncbi:hypothetical protein F4225_08210 [Candidatus Poribacteria bacterium]|nr:hypothetical protein [Candidatus Poribacteria bacterium]
MSILKYTTKYVLLGGLALIVIVGVVALVSNQLGKMKSESVVEGENPTAQATDFQQKPIPVNISKSDKPPPLGETEDTGHWDGNVWRRIVPPKKKKKWWSEDTNKLRLKLLKEGMSSKDRAALARRIIDEYPYSEAALVARFHLYSFGGGIGSESIELFKSFLKYHPESSLLHSALATGLDLSFPEESVAFAKKALHFLPNSSEDYSHLWLVETPIVNSNISLGRAYQRLGDYKSALVHLKTARRLLKPGIVEGDGVEVEIDGVVKKTYHDMTTAFYDRMSEEIAAIEAGKPLLGPNPQPDRSSSDVSVGSQQTQGSPRSVVSDSPSSVDGFDVPIETKDPSDGVFDPSDPSLSERDKAMRAKQAAEEARAAFIQKQQQAQQRAKQEFDRFVRWMQTIENAKSPADLEDFLMREIATQLQGGQSAFTPDRLIRAFETIERHGDAKGMRQLQKIDPDVAKAMSQQQKRNHVPQPTTLPQKNR